MSEVATERGETAVFDADAEYLEKLGLKQVRAEYHFEIIISGCSAKT
jgi:hypothetical protein